MYSRSPLGLRQKLNFIKYLFTLYFYLQFQILWSFRVYLEVVAIVPQLLMFYQDKTNETRSFILYYIYAMGAYRVLYTIHGMYRYFNYYYIDNIAELAGAVQMAIYAVFVGIYLTRSTPYYSELFEPPITVYI